MLRSIFVSLLFASLFLVGCLAPPEGMPEIPLIPTIPGEPVCTTVTEELPVVEMQCGEISYTEQVCELRDLEYSVTELPRVDLCTSDGGCGGIPLGDCQGCTKAMTRCILRITNEEEKKSGTWTVGATYTLGNAGFIKDPITHTIEPGETADFDFNQIYSPGQPINSASCELYVISDPTIEDCFEETRYREECRNVTSTRAAEREVCE